MLKCVFFDLDGTLLPLDEDRFTKVYFHYLYEAVKDKGYNKEEFIDCIWQGTKAMYKNDGSKKNEEAFWDYYASRFGVEALKDKEIVDEFYANDFRKTKACCDENPLAVEIVKSAREICGSVVLSTNPIFPKVATITRMDFVGLKESDFDLVTTYENFNYTKPNPMYFKTILEKLNLKPEEVILFGNNDYEDYVCSKKAGIDCYLVKPYVIKHEELNLNIEEITMDQVVEVIKREYKNRLN